MHRRRALSLIATTIGVSVSSPAHTFGDPEACQDHVAWVARAMEKMERIKVGDTRKNLLRVFKEEGDYRRVWSVRMRARTALISKST
jgi:hypothetical protein